MEDVIQPKFSIMVYREGEGGSTRSKIWLQICYTSENNPKRYFKYKAIQLKFSIVASTEGGGRGP